jgi:transposase
LQDGSTSTNIRTKDLPLMTHVNAPLTPAGRLRLVERSQHRPVAHVAAEAGVARQTVTKWVRRYQTLGEVGLMDRSSAPRTSPTQTPDVVVDRIEDLRREHKWTARQIHLELVREGVRISPVTVARWLRRLGISRRRDIDPTGAGNRTSTRIVARYPGHMVHLDVKKVGRILRRRRVAGSRARIRGREGRRPGQNQSQDSSQDRGRPGRLRVSALGRGRVLTPGLHRGPAGRDLGDDHRVLGPGTGVLRSPRHSPDHPRHHRQRVQLSGEELHPEHPGHRGPSSARPAPFSEAQRQGGTLQPDPGRGASLRPGMDFRNATRCCDHETGTSTTTTIDHILRSGTSHPPHGSTTALPTS